MTKYGGKYFFREKTGYLTNSQLTTSSRRLSQQGLYSPSNRRDLQRSDSQPSSTSSANNADVSTVSSASLPKGWPEHEIDAATMQKSVSFTKHRHGSSSGGHRSSGFSFKPVSTKPTSLTVNGTTPFVTAANNINGNGVMVNGDVSDSDQSGSLSGVPKSPEESQWYTHPVHLEKKYPAFQEVGVLDQVLPTNRPVGTVGAAMAADKIQNGHSSSLGHHKSQRTHHHHHHSNKHKDTKKDRELAAVAAAAAAAYSSDEPPISSPPLDSSMDALAKEYFPVTLGAAYMLNSIQPNKSGTLSPPAKGLPQPSAQPWIASATGKPKRSKSPGRKSRSSRPGSAHSSSSSASKSSLDKMYLLAAEAPNSGRCSL